MFVVDLIFFLNFLFEEVVNVISFLFVKFVSESKAKADYENREEHPTDNKGDEVTLVKEVYLTRHGIKLFFGLDLIQVPHFELTQLLVISVSKVLSQYIP